MHAWARMRLHIKAGSQSDAIPCVALICETHKFITKKGQGFLMTRRKITTQGNARMGSESILVSCCVLTSVDAKTMQRNALFNVVLWTGLYYSLLYNNYVLVTVTYIHVQHRAIVTCAFYKSRKFNDQESATPFNFHRSAKMPTVTDHDVALPYNSEEICKDRDKQRYYDTVDLVWFNLYGICHKGLQFKIDIRFCNCPCYRNSCMYMSQY